MNKVSVLFFSTFRDRVGEREITIEIPVDCTVTQIKDIVAKKYPLLGDHLDFILVAINKDFAFDNDIIPDGAEVAFFPPVSGGSGGKFIYKIVETEIKADKVSKELCDPSIGATSIFLGTVRGETKGSEFPNTEFLEYQSYTDMAEQKMKQIGDEIQSKWPLIENIAIIQRIGKQYPKDVSVLIACNSSHRDSGIFEAVKYGIGRLKQIVPVWKKEVGPNGEEWVEGDHFPQKEE